MTDIAVAELPGHLRLDVLLHQRDGACGKFGDRDRPAGPDVQHVVVGAAAFQRGAHRFGHVVHPDEITGLLVPVWDPEKCIGCRSCELDSCPFDVVIEPIRMIPRRNLPKKRAFLRMHPDTSKKLELVEGDRVLVESIRGSVDGMVLEITEDLDPRLVWSSDGWWSEDGNINLLTDDKHTAFGHTPGFNSVLVRVTKSASAQ